MFRVLIRTAVPRTPAFTPQRQVIRAASSASLQAPFGSATGPSYLSNVTYSGGQAHEGQGGFFSALAEEKYGAEPKPAEALTKAAFASPADITRLQEIMAESDLSEKASQHNLKELVDRLMFHGSPVWGLGMDERRMVEEARKIVESV